MSTFSIKRQVRRFQVVVVKWTSKKCTKKRDARAELLFWSLNLLFFEVVFVVVVVVAKLPIFQNLTLGAPETCYFTSFSVSGLHLKSPDLYLFCTTNSKVFLKFLLPFES